MVDENVEGKSGEEDDEKATGFKPAAVQDIKEKQSRIIFKKQETLWL